jgi:hypothetical protein
LALVLVAAGVGIGMRPLAPTVVVDGTGTWRQVCPGCRRDRDTNGALAVPREALVQVHGLDGRQRSVELWLSARQEPVVLDVAPSGGGAPVLTARIEAAPQSLRIPLAGPEQHLQLLLHARTTKTLPLRLHRIVLSRASSVVDRLVQWLPLVGGLTAFLLLLRRSLALAFLSAVAVMACATLLALVLRDPLGFLELRPAVLTRVQTGLVAILACAALWRVPGRRLALATLAATSWLLFLPTARNRLVGDDFLWDRPWTVSDVASTFVGPEDPAGISNTYYRPISSTAHAVDSWIWGDFVAGFHLTNMLLHALALAAGLLFLERLGLERCAALGGALAWAVHPMSASAVSWVSQRTDLIASIFYLMALSMLLSPLGRRIWPPLLPAALALGSKELAISLPVVGWVSVWLFLPAAERRARRAALLGLCLLAVAHATWWVHLFPRVAGNRLFVSRPGWDASHQVLRGLVETGASLAWPAGYGAWWDASFETIGAVTLVAFTALPLIALWLRRCSTCGRGRAGAAAALAVAWFPLVTLPLFGIRFLDVYRLGFMPAFAFALVVAAVFSHLGHGGAGRDVALVGVLVVWLAPVALDTAAEWGPGGFYYELILTTKRRLGAPWRDGLSPRALEQFEDQVSASDDARAGGQPPDLTAVPSLTDDLR